MSRRPPAQPTAGADETNPLPAPKGTPQERTLVVYNEGVTLLHGKHCAAAEEKFDQALGLNEALAAKLERIVAGVDGHGEYDGLATQDN
jgi:hypothetical protein